MHNPNLVAFTEANSYVRREVIGVGPTFVTPYLPTCRANALHPGYGEDRGVSAAAHTPSMLELIELASCRRGMLVDPTNYNRTRGPRDSRTALWTVTDVTIPRDGDV